MAAGTESQQVVREKLAILRILADSSKPLGSKIIARLLEDGYGTLLSERAVRYHLGLMDEQGLTVKVSQRDGRTLAARGREELENALVADKIGFVIDKIELLAYQTTFDPYRKTGLIPINFSIFPADSFEAACQAMAPVFKAGLCVSRLVAVVKSGQRLNGPPVPDGCIGLATVCSIAINGVLLKAGIPMDSRFGGVLQLDRRTPWRFTDLVQYSGSSLDPSEIFISGRKTSVARAAKTGSGKIVANFREIPAASAATAKVAIERMQAAGLAGPLVLGESSRPLCEIPVGLNKVGMVLIGGLNPVAAAVESGIDTVSKAMSRVVDFKQLKNFWEI
ncbi:MAG: NrpR regulatory domain-containing protein [Dehalococcoidia bacterium]|nr:NrpR regulatory domain-containing protein [Dehalococcoidia bacterium]